MAEKKKKNTMTERPAMTVAEAVATIHAEYDKTAIQRLGSDTTMKVDVISTGNLQIDVALGVGGVPVGRIGEIYGPESSGKTTFLLQVIASCQAAGGVCAFVDAEHALDPAYAAALGVDVENLWVSQPDNGEQALDIVDKLSFSGAFALVVVDSVAALTPKAELAGEMGDSHIGLQARLMSQAMRKISANANKTKTTIWFVNQIREKIGVMFGSPETTPGGRALKFYASTRIDIRRRDPIKNGDQIIGNETNIKIVKNKVAPPFKEALTEVYYGEGFSNEVAAVSVGVDVGVVLKKGAYYYDHNGELIGQGMKAARATLKEDPERMKELFEAVSKQAFAHLSDAPEEVEPETQVEVEVD